MEIVDLPPASRELAGAWQPGYTLYGGAHLFGPATPEKMLQLARRWLKEYPWLTETARRRVEQRLSEPLEDFRIDFEDGYGARLSSEEDGHARLVAQALPQAEHYRRIGIRLKPINRLWAPRVLRTLQLCVGELSVWPRGFCLTLPKVEEVSQILWLLQELPAIEGQRGPLPLEIMIESPQGLRNVSALVEAAGSRCRGVHFGPFDFLASCQIPQAQRHHPLNQQARGQLLLTLSGRGVELADGPTTQLPLPIHRNPLPAQIPENQKSVRQAWELHRDEVLQARKQGFRQGWLLHPAQLISHYSALLQESEAIWPQALERLRLYLDEGGKARASGSEFDDRATARMWVQAVAQAVDLGLIQESQLPEGWQRI